MMRVKASSPSSNISMPSLPSNSSSITLPALPPNPDVLPTSSSSYTNSSSNSHLTLIAVLAIIVTLTSLTLLWLLVFLIRRQLHHLQRQLPSHDASSHLPQEILKNPKHPLKRWCKDSTTFKRFTYSEIQQATDDFSTVIGKGGFGTVYKARFEDGLVAAVKRMHRVSRRREREFCKEMEFLGRLHHRHLVALRGFCVMKTERFLIYEFMENGSLKEHLQVTPGHTKDPLDWRTRIQIAIDVAAALEYLHFFCDPPLCHRDIKSSNILLDQNFAAKVADFGLAHATPTAATNYEQVSTDVRGTPGYLDPEYVTTRQLTVKSDIYSYGVLLLELITARGAVQDNRNLVAWAQPYLAAESKFTMMVDPGLEENYDSEELRSLVRLAKMCTQKEGKLRPTIRKVLSFLYEKLDRRSVDVLQRASVENIQGADGSSLGLPMNAAQSSTIKLYRFDSTSVASTSDRQ